MELRHKLFLIAWCTLAALGLLHCSYHHFVPDARAISCSEASAEISGAALTPGHFLASCRHVVDGGGGAVAPAIHDQWIGTRGHDQLPDSARIVVIFVHGYNTPAIEGIRRGEQLRMCLQQTDWGMQADTCLVTFLWRGDLEFRAAQDSADVSASAFAAFVRHLHQRKHGSPIIVAVSHSLGGRVVLEGLRILRNTEHKEWLRVALLLQPAVRIASVSRWTSPVVPFVRMDTDGCYFDAMKSAGIVLATASRDDNVLLGLFGLGDNEWAGPFDRALGVETHPESRRSDTVRVGEFIQTHSERVSPIDGHVFDVSPATHSSLFEEHSVTLVRLLHDVAQHLTLKR